MAQSLIFGPVLAMVLLTLVVWIYMYVRRLGFIHAGNLDPQQLTASELARLSPPKAANPSDNLKNLFEVPVILYALAPYLFLLNRVDAVYLAAAWIFVLFRALHSAVHCTVNIVVVRFFLYILSTVSVWFIALRAAFEHWTA